MELTYNERRKKQLDMLRGIAKRSDPDSIELVLDAIKVLKFSQYPLKDAVYAKLICDWKDRKYFDYKVFYRNDSYDDDMDQGG